MDSHGSQMNVFSIIIFSSLDKRSVTVMAGANFTSKWKTTASTTPSALVCVSRWQQVVEASAVEGGVVRNNPPALTGDNMSHDDGEAERS